MHASKHIDKTTMPFSLERDLPKVQNFLSELSQRANVPGISAAIIANDVSLHAAAGISDLQTSQPMSPDMHFELGCINKLLIAGIVLELVNAGSINLDQAISHYLPELKGANGNRIKVRHLLSHTAGYQSDNMKAHTTQQDACYTEFSATFNQRPLYFEPGEIFSYCHSSAVILGKIIAVISGHCAQHLIQEKIFKPLGIRTLTKRQATPAQCVCGHVVIPEHPYPLLPFPVEWSTFWQDSLGTQWITMPDLAALGQALIEGKLFSSKSTQQLLSHEITLPEQFVGKNAEQAFVSFGLGCGHYANGTQGLHANTAGQSIALRFDMERNIIIALGINATHQNLTQICINKLFNALLPEDANTQKPASISAVPKKYIDKIAGKYEGNKDDIFNIRHQDKKLIFSIAHPSLSSNKQITLFSLDTHQDASGDTTLGNIPENLSIGFCKASNTSHPIVMIGNHAYRKIS